MPGYIHTCEKCGAHMQVHERYLGRTLKCTSCRTEFLAELPKDVPLEEPAVPTPVEPEARKSPVRFLPWLLLLVPLAGFVWWLGQDQTEGVAETVFRAQRAAGENATLDTGAGRPVLVALDYESVGALVDMQQGAIEVGVASLMDKDSRFLELEAGSKIRVIEYADKSHVARVRILAGPWQGRIVWVPARWIR
jgi:hypothetical protein